MPAHAPATRPSRRREPHPVPRLLGAGVAVFALAAVPVASTMSEGPEGSGGDPASDGDDEAMVMAASTVEFPDAHRPLPLQPDADGGDTDPDADEDEASETDDPQADDGDASETDADEAEADDPDGEQGEGDAPGQDADDPDPDGDQPARSVWDRLADCEAGDWDADGQPIPGTARWDYGIDFAHEGFEQFQGGLNFHPATWDEFRDPDMPGHAEHASREQEIVVGERVLEAQGWGAWPVCSEMLGLR